MTVAILLASGTLLGFAALAVDVGALYVERQQLQSGADAAALAVGNACARRRAACDTMNDPGVLPLAQQFANANADDDHAQVLFVCGRDSRNALPSCAGHPPPNNLTRCVGDRPSGSTEWYVEVYVGTLRSGGQTVLPPVFSRSIGSNGASVGACARASWRTNSTGFLGFGISLCAYSWATNGGVPTTPELAKMDVFDTSGVFERDSTHEDHYDRKVECEDGPPAGWDEAPDFAWFASNSQCLTSVVSGVAAGGPAWSAPCLSVIYEAWDDHDTIRLPVYDGMTGSGASAEYHVIGYVEFFVFSYRGGSGTFGQRPNWVEPFPWQADPPPYSCSPGEQCIAGQVTTAFIASSSGGGRTRSVTLTG
ncbi:Tad domain-containing protein [Luedemannella helvata]|uniref:Tad domain-containing protein n=1 Tax=Luedemannella helvata TaxID=349315 RepID=UPI0031D07490